MRSRESKRTVAELQQLATAIITAYRGRGEYLNKNVESLVELAAESGDEAARASGVVFNSLVEPMADSFQTWGVSLYNRVFSQMIQLCRPVHPKLDRELKRFGLSAEADLLARVERLRPGFSQTTQQNPRGPLIRTAPGTTNWALNAGSGVKRAIVLSRVTLGADVAVTSVLIERLKQALPAAEIVLIGGRKMRELFGGDARLSFQVVEYGRGGLLADRLSAWIDLADAVRSLTDGLPADQYLVVDPDTRLTQLGLLPVCRPESYLFFPSREYHSESKDSIATLASHWSSDELGGGPSSPAINLTRPDIEAGRNLAGRLRSTGGRRIVCLNFGVGGNQAKRVGLEFEQALIKFLAGLNRKAGLVNAGPAIILDRGTGDGENELVDAVVAEMSQGAGLTVLEACQDDLPNVLASDLSAVDLLVWRGRIGLLAALVGMSDLYIGYDSMGQHIAAALGVPCIDVASGYPSPRFLERWKPTGPGPVSLIPVATGSAWDKALDEVAHSARMLLGSR
jgi:ADP-heptose:LPS heptosyltransferase